MSACLYWPSCKTVESRVTSFCETQSPVSIEWALTGFSCCLSIPHSRFLKLPPLYYIIQTMYFLWSYDTNNCKYNKYTNTNCFKDPNNFSSQTIWVSHICILSSSLSSSLKTNKLSARFEQYCRVISHNENQKRCVFCE